MAANDKASRDFANKFNERLGRHTGNRATPTTQRQRAKTSSVESMANASRVGTMAKRKQSSGDSKKKEPVRYITDELKKKNKKETAQELSQTHKDRPWWGDVLGGATRVLDVVSRPSFAVSEGLRNAVQSVNEGEPVWSLGDDLGYGFGQGISGKRKTGFGDVVEESTRHEGGSPRAVQQLMPFGLDKLYGGTILREMDKAERADGEQDRGILTGDPSVQFKRALGLVGEIATDPTTYVGGGVVTGLRGSADNVARIATTQATKEATKSAVRSGVEKALTRIDPFINVRKGSQNILRNLEDEIERFGDEALRYIEAGPQRGKALYGREMPTAYAAKTANAYRQPLIESLERSSQTFLKGFQGAGPKLTQAQIRSARQANPMVGKYLDNIAAQAKDATKAGLPVDYAKFHTRALKEVSEEIDGIADEVYKSVLEEIGQATVKIPTIRVLGNDVISFRRTAGALDNVARRMGESNLGSHLSKSFSYGKNFPGYTSLLTQKVKSQAYQNYEKFHDQVSDSFKALTKDQKKLLTRALIDDTQLDATLEPYRQALKKYYDEIFDEEIMYGLRSSEDAIRARNYNYVYTHGGNQTQRRAFKDGRKSTIHKTGRDTGYTFDQAKRLGLRPEEDAIRALLYRKKKSVRDLTRAWFQDDLVAHYGVAASSLGKNSEAARDLVKINRNHVSKPLEKALREGEDYYVPKVVQDVFETFKRMSTQANSEEAQQWLRMLDWTTRKFKAMATIPFPSYHIRNMMGDMYMGFIDGVRLSDYKRILGTKQGKEVKTLSIGGETMPYKVVEGAFDETASSSGFMATDVGEGVKLQSNVLNRVRDLSQSREDFGRFAHFVHALDEEYGKLKHIKDRGKRFSMAKDAATYRVNKYKFDYGALTPFETSVMKRAIPFYTYTRKAIPTLTEALFLNPKIFSYTNKMLEDLAGDDGSGLSDLLAPDWMREIGYTKLTDEEEPLALRHDFLPTNAFQLLNPGSGEQTQGLAGNVLGMLNPLLQAPMELATGRDTFSGSPVSGPADIIKNKIRPISFGQNAAEQAKDPQAERIFSMLTGIGVSRISEAQQGYQFKAMEDSVQRAVEEFNAGIENKGIRIRYYINKKTNELEYRIQKLPVNPDKDNAKTVATAKTIEEAKKVAEELANR